MKHAAAKNPEKAPRFWRDEALPSSRRGPSPMVAGVLRAAFHAHFSLGNHCRAQPYVHEQARSKSRRAQWY